jgi:PAS domain S-box-containing protein
LLLINKKFLSAILEATPNAIYIKDENGVYLMINENGANSVGKTVSDFIGKTDKDVFPKELADKVMELDRKVIEGIDFIGEEMVTDELYFHSNKFMMEDEDSGERFMVGISTDISELKIAQQKLQEERKKAEDANEHKSIFLQNMSHELRTPLNAIIGFSSIISGESGIKTDELNENFQEYASLINSSGVHLLAIINDLLDLSKIEAGQQEFDEDEIDITYEIQSCIQTLGTMIAAKNITVIEENPEEEITLKGDERIFRQILLNLVSNSIKYSGNDSQVKISVVIRNSRGINVIVEDEGMGMSEEDLTVAMIPFRRTSQVRECDETGTGLGLPLVDAFVKLFQAQLEIKSALGEGTKVTIHFPPERTIE